MSDEVFKIDEANHYFLNEAFHQIDITFNLMVAGKIFGESIMKIDPESDWEIPEIPNNITDLLNYDGEVLSEATTKKLSDAWIKAQFDAPTSCIKLKIKEKIDRIELLGHIINLSLLVESSLNKILLLMKEEGKIDNGIYNSLDKSEIFAKLLFLFKEEVLGNKLRIDRIKHLITLRNHSVHYKATSVHSLDISIEDLVGIWKQIGELLNLIPGHINSSLIEEHKKLLFEKWIE